MECPSCGANVTEIFADHYYSISYDEEQRRWGKSPGQVDYLCGNCMEELDISVIEDILLTVDEL